MASPLFLTGCTSALWQSDTFAHHYDPAIPSSLELYYSAPHKDILVKYDEIRNDGKKRSRFFWLESNNDKINRDRKPYFVSGKESRGLNPIPVVPSRTNWTSATGGLRALGPPDDYLFTLYDGDRRMGDYQLPRYKDPSQKVKQILLTPLAVTVDVATCAAVLAMYAEGSTLWGDGLSDHQSDHHREESKPAASKKPQPEHHRDEHPGT